MGAVCLAALGFGFSSSVSSHEATDIGKAGTAASAMVAGSSLSSAMPVGTCTPNGTPGILYDQTDNAGTTATSSQNFESNLDNFDVRTADDFTVPAGQQWNIDQVNAQGQYFNGAGPALTANVYFFTNAGMLPATGIPICSYQNVPITSGAATGNFNIALPEDCVLVPGTYWVSVQANMDFNPSGQWGWTDRTVQSGFGAAFENPGGGFACSGGNSWVLKTTCAPTTSPDQLFQLLGATGANCGTPTPTNTPTGTPTNTPTATPTATPGACDEFFDSVVAPALPDGWTTVASGAESPWVTTTVSADTAPNAAFAPDPGSIGETELVSRPYQISATGGLFSFRNNTDSEATFDGMVLEISINGGAFQDILAAGGSFAAGGYNGPLSTDFGNPLGGRDAWSGNSGGYFTTIVNLPASANGQMIRMKWRMASDNSVSAGGVRIDTVEGLPCMTTTPTPTFTPTATPTFTPTFTPTATPTFTPTFTPTSTPTNTPTATPTFTPTNTPTATPTVVPPTDSRADFDGDGRTDVSVFRPSNGFWYYQGSTSGFNAAQFGEAEDIPAPADFDDDGKTDVSVFRPSTGFWYRLDSSDGTFHFVNFGLSGDIPQAGDYDGDGHIDQAVFRPANGTWYWLRSIDGQYAGQQFGQNGDKPVGGDYDGDGIADLAVFRGGLWFRVLSSDGSSSGEAFGIDTDLAVPADYDGDDRDDVAVFRPSNGNWYFHLSGGGQFAGIHWGQNGDIPVPGDYDADNRNDVAVYRDGLWFINGSSEGSSAAQFGVAGDVPIPKKYIP
jgi:hypothetical protein